MSQVAKSKAGLKGKPGKIGPKPWIVRPHRDRVPKTYIEPPTKSLAQRLRRSIEKPPG